MIFMEDNGFDENMHLIQRKPTSIILDDLFQENDQEYPSIHHIPVKSKERKILGRRRVNYKNYVGT